MSSPPARVVQPHRPRVIAYKGTPPTGPLRSSPELTSLQTPPHSIGEAGVGLASPSPPRTSTPVARGRRRRVQQRQQQQQRQRIRRLRRRVRPPPPVTGARGTATSSARTRVNRVRNTPRTQQTVQNLQCQADEATRGRRIAAVTETRTITTTYKGANQRPRVTRISTRQTQ